MTARRAGLVSERHSLRDTLTHTIRRCAHAVDLGLSLDSPCLADGELLLAVFGSAESPMRSVSCEASRP